MQDKIKIVIIAAGKGVRMESEEPKALVKFNGKPFIEHILNTISSLNLQTKPVIVVGYKKDRIKAVLGENYQYAEQEEQLGTGDAVRAARNSMESDTKIVVVLAGDQPIISKETLENMISVHKDRKATVTIGTTVVPDFEDWRSGMNHFGRIIRKSDGTVASVIEFKDATDDEREIKELNLSLYVFDSEWLWKNINKIKNENIQGEYYLTDMVEIASKQNEKIEAVPVKNIIEGIHPNSKAELDLLERLAPN